MGSGVSGRRDKGKRRADPRPTKSFGSKITPTRSKSIERWPMEKKTTSLISIGGSGSKMRRGSETLLAPPNSLPSGSSPQPSPTSSSHQGDEKPRGRYLSSIWHGRFNKFSSQGTSTPADVLPVARSPRPGRAATAFGPPKALLDPLSRRSEEALRHHKKKPPRSNSNAPLTAARRASSWGDDPSDFKNPDLTSLNSDYHDVDEETMLVGAGGVSNDPITFAPNPHATEVSDVPSQPSRSSSLGSENAASRDATTSIAEARDQAPETYDSEAVISGPDDSDFDGYSSSFDGSFDGSNQDIQVPELGDDEDSDDEEDVIPLEVRRRGPSSPPRVD